MQRIEPPYNQELLDIIEPFSDWFFQQDRSLIKLKGEPDQDEYHTSKEYLETVIRPEHEGYPESTYGIDLLLGEATPIEYREVVRKLDADLNAFFGSRFNAVKMYYPAGGYMGWHNNWNCPGYNILLSYTQNGNGFFRYKDPATGEIKTIDDSPGGWTAKVGYYGAKDEPDKVYWHCARGYEERLTLGYVIPDENMWDMMVEDLYAQ